MVFRLVSNKIVLGINVMKNFLRKYRNSNDIQENGYMEIKAGEYVYRYLKEIQRHFDLSDEKMRRIIHKIYKDTGLFGKFTKFMKKKISMLKSSVHY